MKRGTFGILWILLALGPSWAQTQEEGVEGADDAFVETVDVNVVNVDVYVTDKQGNPITGLTVDDFELFEDQRPVAITNFYEVEKGRPKGAIEVSGSAVDDTAEMPEEEALLPDDQRLYLIIYVDNFNIRPFNRNRVLRQARQFLYERVTGTDQAMLVSYDRSLNIRHPFTSDPALIGRAMFELEDMSGHAVGQDSERREILQAIDEAQDVYEVDWRVRQYAESLYNDLSFTIKALKEFVDTLSGLEGRKAILYVSDGLQMTSAEDLFQALMHKFVNSAGVSRMQDYNALRKFRELATLASSNRVTFYTIDAAGLRTSALTGAASRGTMTPGFTALVESTYRNNVQAPLRLIAEETGGRAILNTNDVGEGLDRMQNDFGTFYSLGYMPAHGASGRFHRIDVRLKNGKGLKIRHRSGYRSKSTGDRMTEGTRSTLLYGFDSNPLEVELRVGRGTVQDPGLFLVPVAVNIPIANLQLIPRGEFHVGRVKVYFAAFDDEERLSDVQEVPLSVEIPADEIETARSHPYVYFAQLQMRGGSQRIALGVRDEIGAEESFLARTVRIGES